jgi:hypothetical protein
MNARQSVQLLGACSNFQSAGGTAAGLNAFVFFLPFQFFIL